MTTMMMMTSVGAPRNERPLAMDFGESSSYALSSRRPAWRVATAHAPHDIAAPPTGNSFTKAKPATSSPASFSPTKTKPACQAGLSDVERMALCSSSSSTAHLQRPGPSKRNRDAATTMQRIVRGYTQRGRFRFQLLQHRIDSVEQRKQGELDQIQRDLVDRKRKLKEKLTKRYQVETKRAQQVDALYQESKHIITYLRKENQNLRDKNQTLADACRNLQLQNNRIAAAQTDCGSLLRELQQRLAEMQATNDYLHKVIPDYRNAIDLLETELETRNDYCHAEHCIKIKCEATIIRMVESLQEARNRGKLSKDLLGMTMEADEFVASHKEAEVHRLDAGHESFRDMGRSQLLQGLGASLAALHYESDDEDQEIDKYVGTEIAF